MIHSTFPRAVMAFSLLAILSSCSHDSEKMKADSAMVSNAITTDGTGAYVYAWSNGTESNAGTYSVQTTDANGCTTDQPVNIATTPGGANAAPVDESKNESPPPPPPLADNLKAKLPSKIIRTGVLDIEVEDYKKARAAISKTVNDLHGYIEHEDETSDSYAIRNTLSIRVPSASFDNLMNDLGNAAKEVHRRQVNVQDVSAEYYDTEARKKAQQAAEQRYIELLKQARTVGEVMEVQQKIDEIQENVEANQGRLNYLNDQVQYSTIALTVVKNFQYAPSDSPNFFSRMGSAFGNGWQGVLQFFIRVIALWPFWLAVGFVTWMVRRLIKRRRKKREAAAQ